MRPGLFALRRWAIVVWLLFLLVCGIAIGRAHFSADLSAFLPRSPSAGQQVLVEQLQDGLVSRLILVSIDGADAGTRAALSRAMAATLRHDARFAAVNDGEGIDTARDQQFIFAHRYLLSPAVTPQHFTVAGLHQTLSDSLDLLASSAGLAETALLPRDPTGEVAALIDQLDGQAQPATVDGAWASRDGQRAVLVAQTRAAGSDTDAQAAAIDAIQAAFRTANQMVPGALACHLAMTGPGVFAVETRDTIKHDVERISTLSLLLIIALLLTLYRSPRTLVLGLLPVLTGVAAGIAAVSLTFGTVHGLTLGFGTTLLGEAVDYSIYLFVQSSRTDARNADQAMRNWISTYWPIIRLGMLTSVCGFASMLFSGFPGLVQLGLYSIAGLVTAALVTRFVLPTLRHGTVTIRDISGLGALLVRATRFAPRLRGLLLVLVAGACLTLFWHRDHLWSSELSALSPVPKASQALDARLRSDLGAPDVRYLVVIDAATEQDALKGAEQIGTRLQPLVERGILAGFESPARYLPSDAMQRARLASLPPGDVLASRLNEALVGEPIQVKPGTFDPFLADVAAARAQPLLTRDDLRGTSMALAVDALLTEHAGRWRAMLPLRAPSASADTSDTSSLDAASIRAAVTQAQVAGALFIDLKGEADQLYDNYLHEDIRLSLAGFAVIVALLLIALRSPRRVSQVLAPLVAAVLVTTAGFALAGVPLTLLHLIGMLLIVAIGSNYALFFHGRERPAAAAPATLVSLLVANLATVAGFGLLALSHVPLLETFGLTVGPGAILALVFAATLAPRMSSAPLDTPGDCT